MIAKLTGVK